jgi:hypothetical protein
MATYADQTAVALSGRSWHQVKASGPWAADVDELLDKLVADTLPDGALSLLGPTLETRKGEQQERSAARKAREEAVARLDCIEERVSELSDEQVDQAERDLDKVWARWTPQHTRLRERLVARRVELATDDEQPGAATASARV